MPYLVRRQDEISFCVIPCKVRLLQSLDKAETLSLWQNLQSITNVQHDCFFAKCEATGARKRKQERQETDQDEFFIEHKSDNHYVINLCAFHNAHLVRRVLPRALTAPLPLFERRREKDDEMGEKLRGTQTLKKEEAKRKRESKKRKLAQSEMVESLVDPQVSLPALPTPALV